MTGAIQNTMVHSLVSTTMLRDLINPKRSKPEYAAAQMMEVRVLLIYRVVRTICPMTKQLHIAPKKIVGFARKLSC